MAGARRVGYTRSTVSRFEPSPARRQRRAGSAGAIRDERGLSAVEYVILLVLVAAVAIGAWQLFGQSVRCALVRNGLVHASGESSTADAQCFGPAAAIPGESPNAPLREVAARESSSFGCNPSPPFGSSSSGPAPSQSTPSPAPTPAPTPPPPRPPTPAEQTMRDVKGILCKQDRQVLDDLRNRGVSITVYDSIYFEDPYYDGKQWTTQRTDVLGTNSGTQIQMVRTQSVEDQAETLYHEAWHSHQPASMKQRDKEYEAYTKSAEWRIARGLVPADFVKKDKAGKYVVDSAAIKRHVDSQYPGITVGAPGSKKSERIVGRTASGDTIIERADGSTYTRKPRKGDAYMSNVDHPTPPGGYAVDPKLIQCP
jgi:Flp pilus assembly pilin Flp